MIDAFRNGGFPMWFILVTGVALLATTWRYMQGQDKRSRALSQGLSQVTLLLGVLGTVLGLIATLMGVAPILPEKAYLCLIGTGESLNNLAFALIFMVLAAVGRTIGDARAANGGQAAMGGGVLPTNV